MNRIIKKIKYIFLVAKNISFWNALLEFLAAILGLNSTVGKKMNYYKHQATKKYLKKNYSNIIDKYKDFPNEVELIDKDYKIWVFWWQGVDEMPYIVKKCIQSMKNKMQGHDIIIIDKNNYNEYLEIPGKIFKDLNSGNITYACFSDYIRFSLLAKYGGLWLDSTIFLSQNIDSYMNNKTFFTIKHQRDGNTHVCKGKWFVSVMAAGKNSKLFRFSREMMENVLIKEGFVVTYLLVDCILAIAYENYEDIRCEIDLVEVNNVDYGYLASHMGTEISDQVQKKMETQSIHKLSYKENYRTESTLKNTVYEVIIGGK